jgi:hypothetical protein
VQAGTALATEDDLELLAQEQVLQEEAMTATEDAGERNKEEPEEFDRPRWIADRYIVG